MKSMLRVAMIATLALVGGKASLADCCVVNTGLYDVTNINTPDMAPTIEKQVDQCAAGSSLTAQVVACVAATADQAQFTACGVTSKMGS